MRKLLNEELPRKSVNEFRRSEKNPVALILENVRSMNNVGSVFRTADAFLLEKIYLCGFTPCPPHREIHKTALGATETVQWKNFQNTADAITELKNEGYTIFAVEQTVKSIPLQKFTVPGNKKTGLIFGNEVDGVRQETIHLCDGTIEIPQLGTKHSLNISVSVGIVTWELTKNKM
ncbi:MAG TPA: RNA methyltransferase [Bacteroidia bacterium]|nr:RNA methyltransferase [Bacteroidia bacterium]